MSCTADDDCISAKNHKKKSTKTRQQQQNSAPNDNSTNNNIDKGYQEAPNTLNAMHRPIPIPAHVYGDTFVGNEQKKSFSLFFFKKTSNK